MFNIIIQVVFCSILMWSFRSRKWPDFFSVDMQFQLLEDNASNQVPVITNSINSEWMTNHKPSNEVFMESKELTKSEVDSLDMPPMAAVINVNDVESKRLESHDEYHEKTM